MCTNTLHEEAATDTITVSHLHSGTVRDEQPAHPNVQVRDELKGIDPNDREDLTSSEVATSPHQSSTAVLSKREIEKGLRELGLSARQARRMVAGGYRCYSENIDAEKADELLGELLDFYRTLTNRINT